MSDSTSWSRRDFIAAAGLATAAVSTVPDASARQPLPLLKSTINGGRPPGSHPELPTTPEACARTARAVVDAGAGAIHVHVRGRDGRESIRPVDLVETLGAMRAAVPGTPIGVSTHFRILGDVATRRRAVASWTVLPDFASVNFHEEGAVELARQLIDRGVGVEAGLFHEAGARACTESGMAPRCLRLMFEPGGGSLAEVLARVGAMEAVLDAVDIEGPRLLHGSGGTSWPLVDEAARRGYQTRVGFEDSFDLPDGTRARDNAEMVAAAVRRYAEVARGR